MPRRRPLARVCLTAGVTAMLVTGCASAVPAASPEVPGRCVPLINVQPERPSPGDRIVVTAPGTCRVAVPPDGLEITAAPVGDLTSAVRLTVPLGTGEPFHAELQLPDDFPLGEAWAGIEDWDYSSCPDNASCAIPYGYFTVITG
jgi:hypothetical protein